jgi:hypothetical protein
MPYQPEGIWDVVGLPGGDTRNYVQDKGENLYRRTLYTFWKRMAPPPSMEVFNAPSREVCCRPPRAHQHAAASPRHHERPAIRRSRPQARREGSRGAMTKKSAHLHRRTHPLPSADRAKEKPSRSQPQRPARTTHHQRRRRGSLLKVGESPVDAKARQTRTRRVDDALRTSSSIWTKSSINNPFTP